MATNNQDDKALAKDQTFIQSLYDNLSEQSGENKTEQPSDQLDQSILRAAHKAVATPPSDHKMRQSKNNIQTLQRLAHKRKKNNWYYPAATAASLLLVLTIVHYQLNGPINPIYEAPIASIASLDPIANLEKSESIITFAAQNKQQEVITDSLQPLRTPPENLNFQDTKVMQNGTIEQQFATKKLSKSKASAMQERQIRLTKLQTQQRLAFNTKEMRLTSSKMSSKKQSTLSLSTTILSYQTYKTLQAQSKQKTLYWLLQQENDSNYVIELFTTIQASHFYRLNKRNFQLKENRQNKKYPFSAINYITEK